MGLALHVILRPGQEDCILGRGLTVRRTAICLSTNLQPALSFTYLFAHPTSSQ
jgi:hypothetical protein